MFFLKYVYKYIYIYTYVILIKVKLKVRFAVSYKGHIKFTIFLVIGATFWKKGEGVSLSSGSVGLELPATSCDFSCNVAAEVPLTLGHGLEGCGR